MDWSDRYKTPLSSVFSREEKLHLEWRVELALLQALEKHGMIPEGAHRAISEVIAANKVTLERTLEIEKETSHDIMAMVKAIAEQSTEFGGYVHYGATSQDINDTVLALQLKNCKEELVTCCRHARRELSRLAVTYRDCVCIARTHGQHAIPTTMGFKFANYLYELSVAEERLQKVEIFGKFSGAVGTFASLGTDDIQMSIMEYLGLDPVPISTQVVSRVFIADYVYALCGIASVLERLGKEIRNLQRSEISEVCEGFGRGQVGSSTMPQKRNPHKSERICGLARVIRSQLPPTMETISLEHERDLTNSSVERVTLPTTSCLTHYILLEMIKILESLVVDEQSVEVNLHLLGGKQLAERLMLVLAQKIGRQQAHELLRKLTAATDFTTALQEDETVRSNVSPDELKDLLNPKNYVGCAPAVVDRVVCRFGVH